MDIIEYDKKLNEAVDACIKSLVGSIKTMMATLTEVEAAAAGSDIPPHLKEASNMAAMNRFAKSMDNLESLIE